MQKQSGIVTYIATAGDNNVITAKPAVLLRIIVGKDVASSVIEVSDHASDGDGNLVAKYEGNTLRGTKELNVECRKGICIDLTNQTNVTVVWIPR